MCAKKQLDADAPSRSSPTARNLRHYLAGNYTLNSANSTVLTTAQRLSIPEANRRPFTPFTAPTPDANSGVHRFIYALYTQPARFNTAGFESVGMEAATANWNLSRWRTQLGLGRRSGPLSSLSTPGRLPMAVRAAIAITTTLETRLGLTRPETSRLGVTLLASWHWLLLWGRW